MILLAVGFILINWLLSAAWIADPIYALWAAVAVIFWWVAFFRRNPAWPTPNRRFLVYIPAFLWFLAVAGVIQILWAFFVPLELLILWIIDSRLRRRRSATA